ncbi:MAG: DUF3048 domain-containing protein [Bacillota bacterium]|nr:DUF3048 domain-containing protein [Bacillota bacterium]
MSRSPLRLALAAALAALLLAGGCSGGGRRSPSASVPPAAPSGGGSGPAAPAPPSSAGEPALGGLFAVTVDNQAGARPQSGLDQADMVWEVPAEGYITRFEAFFESRSPERIGPVRSARPYFAAIAAAYGAVLVHAGGSQAGFAAIQALGVAQIDGLFPPGDRYFSRDPSRRAPHNLYTSAQELLQAAARLDLQPGSLGLSSGPAPAGGKPVSELDLHYLTSGIDRNVIAWRYRNGAWERWLNGQPFRTREGAQVRAGDLVVLVTDIRLLPGKEGYLDVRLTGSGDAWFLRDGRLWQGRWSKPSAAAPFSFEIRAGDRWQAFPWAPGAIWVQVVGDPRAVSFGSPAAAPGS